jgi:RHS repeat-associated protein
VTFGYDASGNRVRKESTTGGVTTKQCYVRDAQGNILSVYKQVGTGTLKQGVDYLYGATRVAELIVNRDSAVAWNRHYYRIKGNRHYELTNHLGNVLSVVTDRRLAKEPTASNAPTYYLPDVYMVENYYAFGQPLPKWNSKAADAPLYDPTKYRYGFNGKEDDDEWSKQDYGFRIYDGRIGRFLSEDPLTSFYPELTPYQFAGNMPIWAIDLDGLEPEHVGSDGEMANAPAKGYEDQGDQSWSWTGGESGSWNVNATDKFEIIEQSPKSKTPRAAYVVGATVAKALGADRGYGAISGTMESTFIAKGYSVCTGKTFLPETANGEHGELSMSDRVWAIPEAIPGGGAAVQTTKSIIRFAKLGWPFVRVKLRKATKKSIDANQPKNASGQHLDPDDGSILGDDKQVGHKWGQEFWRRMLDHFNQGRHDRKSIIEAENDPDLYEWQDRKKNQSHEYEKKD